MMNGALQKAPMFLVFPCAMAVAGYYFWKANMRDLMDEGLPYTNPSRF
jgi:hypothetical protein